MRRVFLIVGCVFLISACQSPEVVVNLVGSRRLNQNSANLSTPVMVHFYQLISPLAFKQLSFAQLVQSNAVLQQSNIVDVSQVNLLPGQTKQYQIPLAQGVKYLGVVGEFQNPSDDYWRVVIQLKPYSDWFGQSVKLRVRDNQIKIERG